MNKIKKQFRWLGLAREPGLCEKTFFPALVCSVLAATLPLAASATVYVDSYTLMTTGQSQYAGTGQASASYNSGFQGVTYGTYAGNAPVNFGVNAISGSQNALVVPSTPGTPSVYIPGTPGTPDIGIPRRACVLGVCVTLPFGGGRIPGIPATPGYTIPGIPGTPAVYADTRTGFAVGVASSGKVGVEVAVQANGGGIAVNLPVKTELEITRTVNNAFHVGGATSIASGASITATAPSFKADVSGVVNLDNAFSGTGCFLGAGCSSSSSSANINKGKFSLVGLDTAQAKPLSVLGETVPVTASGKTYTYRQGEPPCEGTCPTSPLGKIPLAVIQETTPQNHTGGVINGANLSLSTSNPLLRVTADLTGIAQSVLGTPVDLLNPSVKLLNGAVSASGTTFNAQAGVTIGVSQAFSLDTQHMLATLQFDKPVYELIAATPDTVIPGRPATNICLFGGCFVVVPATPEIRIPGTPEYFVNLGNTITVDLSKGGDFYGDGNLISRSYTLSNAADFTSDTRLNINPTIPLSAACYNLRITGGISDSDCAYSNVFQTANLLDVSLYSNTFNLGGFNSATFFSPVLAIDPVTPIQTPIGEVPEPATLWLGIAALLAFAASRRSSRNGRRQVQQHLTPTVA